VAIVLHRLHTNMRYKAAGAGVGADKVRELMHVISKDATRLRIEVDKLDPARLLDEE
jgi:hypothetical protein